ncbi:hypothetical protein SAMN02799630_02739 [Paenibacillus sp. UNCCL117]|uniref:hypothetical protein n=1 Tax=unclassified Paenibacillus TaxID=185978 RepID=UPI000881E39E|nr:MULTISPECIES: hypothetical protein [unclassified Paenibacillus]SDD31228.1 hypothetical protein SAMN04488602_107229 [Paenibacillus sp. cl123]SFW40170.1 hypothetical protein SAMN02799630_02739 [Paenibacillus sp. UNCCL117]
MDNKHRSGPVPDSWEWGRFLHDDQARHGAVGLRTELEERLEDLSELRWLLDGARDELELYRDSFPDGRFERELAAAFAHQADKLERQTAAYEREPEACDWNAYLGLKYEIRTLIKQLGAVVAGSDWQSPCKRFKSSDPDVPREAGYTQEEQNTYRRSYGSEAVKDYEAASLRAYYAMSAEARRRCVGFLTTSGMKALELALAAYRSFTGEALPAYLQQGFYGEGVELARLLLNRPTELEPQEMYAKVERNEPIGCLLVDPGMCWPVRPPVDLGRLMEGLCRHRQEEPLYVIVDRTLTTAANPLFAKYADRLPPHVVLISVESGIKYMQLGMELANTGFMVAAGRQLEQEAQRQSWVTLLALLDAGADPLTVRQLPVPDQERLTARLSRLNRNAYWVDAFLTHLMREGKITAYQRSVEPSDQYLIEGRRWMGSLFYIQLPGCRSERDYQAWVDAFVAGAPEEAHFVSGGSFGFDTFRMNAVAGELGLEAALRVSVGREPIGQLLSRLVYLFTRL